MLVLTLEKDIFRRSERSKREIPKAIYLCSQPLTKCHSHLGRQVIGAGYSQTYARPPTSVWRSWRNGRFTGEGWPLQAITSNKMYHMQGLRKERAQPTYSPLSPTTSGSSELDAASNMFSAGSEDTKESASGFSRSPEPVKEDWESKTPFSNWKLVHLVCSSCICHLFGIYTVFM